MSVAAGSLAYIRALSIVRGVKTEETWPNFYFSLSPSFFLLQPASAKTSPSFRLKCKQVLHNSVVVTRQQPLPSAERSRDGKGLVRVLRAGRQAGGRACVQACVRACLCHFALLQHTRLSLR